MDESFPRVIIINQQSIRKNNATGITLRSLWEEWPLDKVIELYLDEYETQVDYKNEFRSICLPSNMLNKAAHSGSAKKLNTEIKQQEVQKKASLKTNLRQAAVLAIDMIPVQIPAGTLREIDQFNPEIIYTLGATVNTMRLAYGLSKSYGIPIVIHYMDNWPEKLQWESNPLIKPYKRALDREHKRCLYHSLVGLAISPQMAEAYSKKFKMPFFSIMNSVDVGSFHLGKKQNGNPLKFVYAGGLHLNRWKALQDISKALIDENINAELHIYTSRDNAALYQSQFRTNTFFHESVDHSRILDVYRDADVLVHAETENPLLLGFFKYSISTKIPEYLASGRVSLFYGPKDLGLYKYLKDNEAAFTASGYEELCDTLKMICSSKKNDMVLKNAMKLALANHNATQSRKVLKNTLADCIRQSRVVTRKETVHGYKDREF